MRKILFAVNSIRAAAIILIITTTLSNILGVIRDHFLAQKIASSQLDVYYAAFRLPDVIFNLLILGAVASAFIPIFTTVIHEEECSLVEETSGGEKPSWRLLNNLLTGATIFLLLAIVLMFILMPLLMGWLVPNFSPDKQRQTIELARLMLLSPLFFGLSYIFGGVLNCFQRFLVYSLAPIIYNLAIIFGAVVLAEKWGVMGVGLMVVIGAFLHLAIQVPSVIQLGWRPRIIIDFADEKLRKIVELMLPRTIGLAANQIILLFFTALASAWSGTIAYFSLANNIQTVPTIVLGSSLATAIFPHLSKQAAQDNHAEFSHWLIKSFRYCLLLLLPATFLIIALRIQIIRLLLGSGHFNWPATIATANILGIMALSLVATGTIPLLARGFWARQDTKTPMWIAIFSMLIAVSTGWFLSAKYQILGLAAAYSLASLINGCLLYCFLRKKLTVKINWLILSLMAKILFACFLMTIVVQLVKGHIGAIVDMDRFWGVAVQFTAAAIIGAITYIFALWLTGEKIRLKDEDIHP
ncbi:MAG: Integral membrane protein MviN [Candidatus Berkelbacteria bacterium Licking1014_2]|uniref:Probable lipid II flippase MurJ n=1 Tax=Candidatus Berkelbacteria bacterium Licking1014_2 TaxID=2017146 RepID=A0A554LW04_9BACT|nr:MAG: Integral membrane protein MviN [Candidatus Berkelbacteria bacterium Licking1014_2]